MKQFEVTDVEELSAEEEAATFGGSSFAVVSPLEGCDKEMG
jgi:hypothetical protein